MLENSSMNLKSTKRDVSWKLLKYNQPWKVLENLDETLSISTRADVFETQ